MLLHRKEPKANPSGDGKDIISGLSSAGAREENNLYAKVYHKDGTEVDLTKNSLPSGVKVEKVIIIVKYSVKMSVPESSLMFLGN